MPLLLKEGAFLFDIIRLFYSGISYEGGYMGSFTTQNILGQSGDAIIEHDNKKIFVPYLLENETFDAEFDGKQFSNITITEPSDQRQKAECDAFGSCGGCSFQHMKHDKYQNFKLENFKNIFSDLYDGEKIEGYFCAPQTRRRTTLSLYKKNGIFAWGYKARASKKIISFEKCHVVTQKLNDIIQKFVPTLEKYIPSEVQVKLHFTEAENGFDLVVRGCKQPKDKFKTEIFSQLQNNFLEIIRIIWDHDIFYHSEVPFITLDDKKIYLSPEMFLQPSLQGQKILIDLVLSHMPKAKKKQKICDLFSGAGTFTLPLSHYGLVDAYDNAGGAIKQLVTALQEYGLQKKITTFDRDLYRDPLSVLELKKYDVIITDPPRNGMQAQAKSLAKAKPAKIIMVFCDAKTAYRDSKILCDAGYKMTSLSMVDQFVYSQHIEGVAVFTI